MTDPAERLVEQLVPALRKCAARPAAQSTRYAGWSPAQLKVEAIRLQKLTGLGKRACSRAFGKPWETVRDWLDADQPKKHPPEDFVEWLAHRAAAHSLVRVA